MKKAIYIGKGYRKEFGQVFIEGHGVISSSELRFGMTGKAFPNGRQWDFRPDGLNISHMIYRKDLYFPA